MGKNIVVLCDGTWCKPDTNNDDMDENTNVSQLHQMCIENDKQITFYQKGIGTYKFGFIRKILGGAFGMGASGKIKEAYAFLAKNYEQGDKLFLFGFSRGAFIARSLSAFLSQAELLDGKSLSDKELKKQINELYDLYKDKDKNDTEKKSEINTQKVEIEMLGVWDTVQALGIPVGDLKEPSDEHFSFHDTQISDIVNKGYHAVAIDEQRQAFDVTLWNQADNIEEVWFAGTHGDVGGGKKIKENGKEIIDRSHSDITFEWMLEKAKNHNLLLKDISYDWNKDITKRLKSNYNAVFGDKIIRVIPPHAKIHPSVKHKLQAIDPKTGNYIYNSPALTTYAVRELLLKQI